MEKSFAEKIKMTLAEKKRIRRRNSVMITLAVTVFFLTVFALMHPAMTAESGGETAAPEAAERAASAGTATLIVRKEWADLDKHDPVTFVLIDGVTNETVDSVTVGESGGWTGEFKNIDCGESGEFPYYVRELPVEGYQAEYSQITQIQQTESVGGYWVEVTDDALRADESYIFVIENGGSYYAPAANGEEAADMSAKPVTLNGPVRINEVDYPSCIADTDDSVVFKAVAASGGVQLYNSATGKYMNADGCCAPESFASVFDFQNGKLYSGDDHLKLNNVNGKPYQDFTCDASSADGSIFTLYRWVEDTSEVEDTYELTVTNTRVQRAVRASATETTSLTVKKTWSDYWETHDPVTVTLMHTDANGNTTSTGITANLSEENDWTYVFENLAEPEEGGSFAYSVVEEPVAKYMTQYGEIRRISPLSDEYWVPVADNRFRDGGVYLISSNNNRVMTESNSSPTARTVTLRGSIEIGGVTYGSHFRNSDLPAGATFEAVAVTGGFHIRNTSSGDYLRATNYSINFVGNSSSATPFSISNGRISYSNRYLRQSGSSYSMTTNAGNATMFRLYERPGVESGGGYETTVTNTRIYPQNEAIDVHPEVHKTIDYLGDGGENPDTTLSGKDYYRLYLDAVASHQPVDLLFVVDMTQSMETNDFGGTRQAALDEIINGTIISGSGATAVRDTDGIIFDFLSMHPDNKVAVTGFSGGNADANVFNGTYPNRTYEDTKEEQNPITLNWTQKSGFPNGGATPRDCYARVVRKNEPPGTNYEAALMRATELLSDPSVVNDGHIKVMMFFTDGEPNVIFQNGYLWKDNSQAEFMQQHTREFFVNFIETHPGLVSYIVGIFPEGNYETTAYLSSVAAAAHINNYHASNAAQLRASLREIVELGKISLVEMTDELSAHVEYYAQQPDLKVTRTDESGNTTVVWENGAATEHNFNENGVRFVNNVVYTAGSSGDSTGTVKVVFNPDSTWDRENTFTLSYNVKLTDSAGMYFAENGYDAVGDAGTDYGENVTSSLKPGLHSNNDAKLAFMIYNQGYEEEYPHPVVQTELPTLALTVKKLVTGGSASENFTFEMVLRDSAGEVITGFPAGEGYTVDGATGKIIFSLAHDQSVVIDGILYGTLVTVAETGHEGYITLIKEGNMTLAYSDICSITLTAAREITFVNNAGVVLPETGGTGPFVYASGGLSIMVFVLLFGFGRRKKERRSDT